MKYTRFNYIIGMSTSKGFGYGIEGDDWIFSNTKADCRKRIRNLYRWGKITKEQKDYLLNDLKAIKRP